MLSLISSGGLRPLSSSLSSAKFVLSRLLMSTQNNKDWVQLHGDLGGSPYTVKVACALRYRRIPHSTHQLLPGGFDLEGDWKRLGFDHIKPKVIPVLKWDAQNLVMNDSTLILKEMEKKDLEIRGRSLYPTDPTTKFLALLMEDFFDEWFVKVMFGLRWTDPADAEWSAQFLVTSAMMGRGQDLGPIREMGKMFGARQIDRMKMVGSTNPDMLWKTLRQVGSIMDQFVMEGSMFLFGDRPSVADVALYGQTAQFLVDTSTEKVIRQEFPCYYAYLRKMADLSGVEGTIWNDDHISTATDKFLHMASETYLPFLKANYEAIHEGKDEATAVLYEKSGDSPIQHSQPPIKYQAKCYDWLCQEYQSIPDKTKINEILTAHNISPDFFTNQTSSKL